MSRARSKLKQLVIDAAWEPVSPTPLAAYRIAFALLVLAELVHLVHRRQLVFVDDPLHGELATRTAIGLWVWFAAIACQLVGFLTPLSAIVNWRCIVAFIPPGGPYSYHADMLYVPAALLLVFLPTYRVWSIDARVIRRWWKIDLGAYAIPRLYNNLTIFMVIGFMYVDSVHYKLESSFWLDGLGFWFPASFPSFTTFSWNAVLNHHWLMVIVGYVTLVFEVVFIFVFWIPQARLPLVVVGLALHLGIAIAFPIPLFGLLVVAMYINFLPLRRSAVPPGRDFLPFDRKVGRGLLLAMVAVTIVQASITLQWPFSRGPSARWLRNNIGLTKHMVFSEWAFGVMKRDIALVYVAPEGTRQWIPYVTEDGHIGSEAMGRFWSTWWNNSLDGVDAQSVFWARAAEEWMVRTDHPYEGAQVIVKARPVITDPVWEKDRHDRMAKQPWSDIGRIHWHDGRRTIELIPPRPH